jgi:6-phosphogluconolactonase (cycloisomerase 2 family)
MLAYAGESNHGYIKTFSINGAYAITEIDSLEFDGVTYQIEMNLAKLTDSFYVLSNSAGVLRTFSIDANADNITQIDSLSATGRYGSIGVIDSTHFVVAYTGSGDDGFVRVFSVDANADNITSLSVLEHDTADGTYSSLAMINSSNFIVAYTGTDYDGFIKTFSISADYGTITQKHSLEHDTDTGYINSLAKLDATHYMLAYTGPAGDGYVKTFLLS